MKSEEVLRLVRNYGIEPTLRTLQRYEEAGLLPAAERGWGPSGFGRYARYTPAAAATPCTAGWATTPTTSTRQRRRSSKTAAKATTSSG